MEIVSLALAYRTRSDIPDRDDRRDRGGGYRPSRKEVAYQREGRRAGPSVEFLIQVAAQMQPIATPLVCGGYAPHPWRCGVCANEIG